MVRYVQIKIISTYAEGGHQSQHCVHSIWLLIPPLLGEKDFITAVCNDNPPPLSIFKNAQHFKFVRKKVWEGQF